MEHATGTDGRAYCPLCDDLHAPGVHTRADLRPASLEYRHDVERGREAIRRSAAAVPLWLMTRFELRRQEPSAWRLDVPHDTRLPHTYWGPRFFYTFESALRCLNNLLTIARKA